MITIIDGHVRAAGEMAVAGAAFFTIHNAGPDDDRLIAAETDAAKRVELHTHLADGEVMRMRAVEGGLAVPADGVRRLESGGDHVMLMGLAAPLGEGDTLRLTLIFEKAGELVVGLPVDSARSAQ